MPPATAAGAVPRPEPDRAARLAHVQPARRHAPPLVQLRPARRPAARQCPGRPRPGRALGPRARRAAREPVAEDATGALFALGSEPQPTLFVRVGDQVPLIVAALIPSSCRSRRRLVSDWVNTPITSRNALPVAVSVSTACTVALSATPVALSWWAMSCRFFSEPVDPSDHERVAGLHEASSTCGSLPEPPRSRQYRHFWPGGYEKAGRARRSA